MVGWIVTSATPKADLLPLCTVAMLACLLR
jgi:hypothetical protein